MRPSVARVSGATAAHRRHALMALSVRGVPRRSKHCGQLLGRTPMRSVATRHPCSTSPTSRTKSAGIVRRLLARPFSTVALEPAIWMGGRQERVSSCQVASPRIQPLGRVASRSAFAARKRPLSKGSAFSTWPVTDRSLSLEDRRSAQRRDRGLPL